MIKWKTEPIVAFKNLDTKIANKALRIAINAGASPTKKTVVANTPTDTKALSKAMRIKVINYKKNHVWLACIGAGKKVTVNVKKGKTKKQVTPARYQPKVNKEQHFMEQALQQSKSSFITKVNSKLAEVIPQLIREVR